MTAADQSDGRIGAARSIAGEVDAAIAAVGECKAAELRLQIIGNRRNPAKAKAGIFVGRLAVGEPPRRGGNRDKAVAGCTLRIERQRRPASPPAGIGMPPK
jgi:hypothetical protein